MSDSVKVVLTDDYYEHEDFSDYDPKYHSSGSWEVHEIPREQRDRWQAAKDAYEQMQAEIEALMRRRAEEKMAERKRSNPIKHVYLRR